jgi:hypothetical protein
MALRPYVPERPEDARDCNLCAHAMWDPETKWGRCATRPRHQSNTSGLSTIHKEMSSSSCPTFKVKS